MTYANPPPSTPLSQCKTQHMGRLRDEGRLRVMNCGLFSLLLDDNANRENCLPKSQAYG